MSILKKMGIKMDRDSYESLKKSAEETHQVLIDMGVNTKDPQPERGFQALREGMKKFGGR